MKQKTKKIAYRILKIIWFILGGLILLWTILWRIKMSSIENFGVLIAAILFAVGIYALIIFIAITILFIFIKWIIKICKQKK